MSRYRCPECDYTYDETLGEPQEGYEAGRSFDSLPDDFVCPDCAVCDKADFLTD